ncbi:HAD family hydrolase [Neobacillus mesonae]|nr:HAD family hydrolase [Neobacillus mesonae]
MIKAFLFDLDGTLLDRNTSLRNFVLDQLGRIPELQGLDKDLFLQRFIDLDQRGYVWKDKVYAQLVHEFGLSVQPAELLADYVHGFQQHCVPFPHLERVLQYLKNRGLKLGMITNGFGGFQRNNIEGLGIAGYFDAILISELEGLRKPDPAIFLRALDRLGVNPEESVYVGDHPENDVAAAYKVGMKAIWKEDLYYDEPVEMDARIKDLDEIIHYFELSLIS